MKTVSTLTLVVAVAISTVALVVVYGCAPSDEQEALRVVATIFPLYDAARFIGGDRAEVSLLLPPAVDIHSFEPTPSDIAALNNADIFIYIGAALEPWAAELLSGVENEITVVNSTALLALHGDDIESTGHTGAAEVESDRDNHGEIVNQKEQEEHGDDHSEEEHGDDHSEGEDPHLLGFDSHIWLDFENAERIAGRIADAFAATDPSGAPHYRRRFEEYASQLRLLDSEYRTTLAHCQRDTIVHGGHNAFGHLAARYGLHYRAAYGFTTHSQPSARDITELIAYIQENNITHVFYEEQLNPAIATTLSKESGVEMLALNPASNITRSQLQRSVNFFQIMHDNLAALAVALGCT